MQKWIFVIIVFFFISGCQAVATQRNNPSSLQVEGAGEIQSAIESVAGAVSKRKIRIKYCPVCGRRFSPDVVQCPFDGAKLKDLEE